MSATAIIAELSQAGIRLTRNGNRLHVEAPHGTITKAIIDRLTANKPALLALLASPDAIRGRLLHLAASEGLPASCVTSIPADELHQYAELENTDDSLSLALHLRARCSLCGGSEQRHDHPEAP